MPFDEAAREVPISPMGLARPWKALGEKPRGRATCRDQERSALLGATKRDWVPDLLPIDLSRHVDVGDVNKDSRSDAVPTESAHVVFVSHQVHASTRVVLWQRAARDTRCQNLWPEGDRRAEEARTSSLLVHLLLGRMLEVLDGEDLGMENLSVHAVRSKERGVGERVGRAEGAGRLEGEEDMLRASLSLFQANPLSLMVRRTAFIVGLSRLSVSGDGAGRLDR